MVEIGKPEENPHKVVEPLENPVPVQDPRPAPSKPRPKERDPELVPA
jgi:hypothetical protein